MWISCQNALCFKAGRTQKAFRLGRECAMNFSIRGLETLMPLLLKCVLKIALFILGLQLNDTEWKSVLFVGLQRENAVEKLYRFAVCKARAQIQGFTTPIYMLLILFHYFDSIFFNNVE